MKKILTFAFLALFAGQIFAKQAIQVVGVEPSKQPEYVKVNIVLPKKGSMQKNFVWIQTRVRGFALGAISQLPRRNEISTSSDVQSLHVVVDDMPYFVFDGLSLDPLEDQGDYDEALYKFKIPFRLSEGLHVLRIFPCRSFGEGLNKERNFASTYFYIGKKKGSASFLKDPFITYNEPTGVIKEKGTKPLLLDFYVHNCELSKDGYKVQLYIDDVLRKELFEETPYYIYGLRKGHHKIRLRLVDKDNELVKGPFNDVLRTIKIE